MKTNEYSYTVIFQPAEEGSYVVRDPALPEVVTEGDTLEEARAMAEDAMRPVLQDRLAEGAPIPQDIEAEPIKEKVRVVVSAAFPRTPAMARSAGGDHARCPTGASQSARPVRFVSSRSGRPPSRACSPFRLIHAAGTPSARAGTRSWK